MKSPLLRSKSLAGLLALLLLSAAPPVRHNLRGSNSPRPNPPATSLDIPEATEITSKLPTSDAAFREMVVSHSFESSDPRVRGGIDIIQWITDDLKLTVQGKHPDLKGVALKDVKKAYQFYGFGSDKLTTQIVESLRNSDIGQIEIVTDLNLALDGAFKPGQEYNSDWGAAKIKDSEPGRALKKLLEAGCTFGGQGRCQIRGGQPLYNSAAAPGAETARVPIFHHKDMFTVVMERDKSGRVIRERCVNMKAGTANMNETAPRYNRFFDVVDPDLNQAAYEHHLRVIQNSDRGGRIFEMESKPPLRVNYADGTSIQFASTDGKFELNQAIVADWKKWAASPDQYRVQRIWGSHFATTDADLIYSQAEVLKANPDATAFWIVDQRFVRGEAWAVPGPMAGITAVRPFGGPLHPYPRDLRIDSKTGKPRIDAFAYIREAEGGTAVETDREAAPNGVHLWHDKTTVSLVDNSASSDAGETLKRPHYKVSTLSYNASHNFHNAESQLTMNMNRDSWVANGIVESVERVVKLEPQYAIRLDRAIPLENLAILTGHRDVEVKPADVDQLLATLRNGDSGKARQLIEGIAARPTTISRKIPASKLKSQLDTLEGFLKWMGEQPGGAEKVGKLGFNDLNGILDILHNEGMSASHARTLLSDILWGMGPATETQGRKDAVERLLPGAWKAMGIKKSLEALEHPEVSRAAPVRALLDPVATQYPPVARNSKNQHSLLVQGEGSVEETHQALNRAIAADGAGFPAARIRGAGSFQPQTAGGVVQAAVRTKACTTKFAIRRIGARLSSAPR